MTQATLDDIIDPNIEENANQNVADVINYIKASQYASTRLNEIPICNRLLKQIHEILMQNVRGGEKNPGEFRHSQSWIGPAGSTLNKAKYVPTNCEEMIKAMSELEKYNNCEHELDPLIKIALIQKERELWAMD